MSYQRSFEQMTTTQRILVFARLLLLNARTALKARKSNDERGDSQTWPPPDGVYWGM